MGGVCGKQNRYVQNRLSSDSDSDDSDTDSSTGSTASSATSSRSTKTSVTSKNPTKIGVTTTKLSGKVPTKMSYKPTLPGSYPFNAKIVPKSPYGPTPAASKQKFPNVPNSPNLQNKPSESPVPTSPVPVLTPASPGSKIAAKSSVCGTLDSNRLVLNVKDLDSNMGYLVLPKKPVKSDVQPNNAPTAFNYTKQFYQQEIPGGISDFRPYKLPGDTGILNKTGVYYENKAEFYVPGQQEIVKWEQTAITPHEQKYQFYYDAKKDNSPMFTSIPVPQYQMQMETAKYNTQQSIAAPIMPSFPMESAKLLMVECGKESNYIPLPKATDYCVQMGDQQTQNKVVRYFEENLKQAVGPKQISPIQSIHEQPYQFVTLNTNRTQMTGPSMVPVAIPIFPQITSPTTKQAYSNYTNYARFQPTTTGQVPMIQYVTPPVPGATSQPTNLRLNAEQLYLYNQQYATPTPAKFTTTQNTLPGTQQYSILAQQYTTEQRMQQQQQQQLSQQPSMAATQSSYIGTDRFGAAQDYNSRQLKMMQSGVKGESKVSNAAFYGAPPWIVTRQATSECLEHLRREIGELKDMVEQRRPDDTFTRTVQRQQNEMLSKIEELCLNFKKMQIVYENTIRDLAKDNYFNSQIGRSDSVMGQKFNKIKSDYQQISSQADIFTKSTLELVNNYKNQKGKNVNTNISPREVDNLNCQIEKLTKAIQTLKHSYNPEILKTISKK